MSTPRWAVTSPTEPPLDALIPCRVYRIWGPHPDTGGRRLVYLGECVDTANRGPRDRFAEHLEDQPWGDTIPDRTYDDAIANGTLVVSTTVYPTKRAAKLAEQAAIIREQPLYNWVHNQLNPHRIPKWEAERQRAERDRNNDVPTHLTWAAIHGRQPVHGWRRLVVAWKRLRRRQRRQIATAVSGGLFTLTLGLFVFVVSPLSLATSMTVGVGAPAIAVLWFNKPARRRKVRYALNEAGRWAVVVAVLARLFMDLT